MVGIAKWQIIGTGGADTQSGKPNTPSDAPRPCCLLTGNAASQVFRQKPPGIQLKGTQPFKHLGVDCTEMKPHRHYSYLLVMVCTFSGWVKAFPTWTERASEVAQCLLREIVPRFGLPTSIGSDNGPAFVAGLVQQVSKTLKSNGNCTLHIGPEF